ncbi:MAG: hypothetical protein AAF870_00045 [Pseudomonadota bacterium]
MWILLIPLVVAEIAFWVALVYFAWRGYRAIVNGNRPMAVIWLCLIAVPFVFYFYKHVEADAKEVERANQIAALPRAAISKEYPKLLEIHGHATEFELLIFLDAMTFELQHHLQGVVECFVVFLRSRSALRSSSGFLLLHQPAIRLKSQVLTPHV